MTGLYSPWGELPESGADLLPGVRPAGAQAPDGAHGAGAPAGHIVVPLSDVLATMLALVAAHDGLAPERLAARLIDAGVCARAETIGLPILAGFDAGTCFDAGDDDLVAPPEFERAQVARPGRHRGREPP